MSRTTDNKREQKSWKKYLVTWHVDATGSHYLWAKNKEHAKEMSENIFFPGSDNTELGDPQNIVDCQLVSSND